MIFLSILGLAILILAHEAGHFFAARSVGVGVKEFAVGFPPRWFRRKKGETEYSIGVLPLGGFVRLEGETPGEEADPQRSFSNHSVWARSWILVAGVLANFYSRCPAGNNFFGSGGGFSSSGGRFGIW